MRIHTLLKLKSNCFLFCLDTVLFISPPLIFGHSALHCSDSDALEAFNNPTAYCQAQGTYIMAVYCITKINMIW